jgi:hypothetical protein
MHVEFIIGDSRWFPKVNRPDADILAQVAQRSEAVRSEHVILGGQGNTSALKKGEINLDRGDSSGMVKGRWVALALFQSQETCRMNYENRICKVF